MAGPYYGKYRGTVKSNVDPKQLGRVQVSVPEVYGDGRAWAEHCVPYAGRGVGLIAIPAVGTSVWIEFEHGDSDFPILVGSMWGPRDAPPSRSPGVKMWETDAIAITLSDIEGKGGFTIEVGSPAVQTPMRFAMTSSGIELTIGSSSVVLTATSVSINDGALEVT